MVEGEQAKLKVCAPVEITMEVIGGKWKPLIIYHLMRGTLRFNELRRLMPLVTQRMLTRYLRELEQHGVVHRKIYAEVPPRVEYTLTPLGQTLKPVMDMLLDWGMMYLGNHPEIEIVSPEDMTREKRKPHPDEEA